MRSHALITGLYLCLVAKVSGQPFSDCTRQASGFTGACVELINDWAKPIIANAPEPLQRFAFYVRGRQAYPPTSDGKLFRYKFGCSTVGECSLSAGDIMNGTYAVRDRKERVWIEERYENGYIKVHTEYDGRTGRIRGRFEYLDSAWVTADGAKVLYEIFDECTGQVTSRNTWMLRNGEWAWGIKPSARSKLNPQVIPQE